MKPEPITLLASTLLVIVLAQPTPSQASMIVAPGWNLLQTDPASTAFFGEPFQGVPLGTFDFLNPAIGVQDVGATDTLIRRIGAAAVPGPGNSATVVTVVDAFQLRSVNPVSILGGPLGIYYVTLASRRGGPVSVGTMTINFGPEGDPHGTFSSSFILFVDVRLGGLDGPILDSRPILIPDSGSVPWTHDPTGPIQIQGVNTELNGQSFENDFWIKGNVLKQTPNGTIGARNAGLAVPDLGSSLFLLSLSLAGIGWMKAMSGTFMNRKCTQPSQG
jgi:hypothetical protein